MSEDPSSESTSSKGLVSRLIDAVTGAAEPGAGPHLNGASTGRGGDLILNVQEFQTKRVSDVMVPRADITALEIDTPLKELASAFAEAAHSRLPVYRETLDDPVGVAHIKDLVGHLAVAPDPCADEDRAEARVLPDLLRPLLYVPASMRAIDLLLKMQSRRMHMALVVDEFGGTDGLVTLEDLLEPIVGDIEDEHDTAEAAAIRAKSPQCWDADARAEIADLESVIGREIATDEEEADVHTLGGLVFRIAGRVPERGEVIAHPAGVEFEVVDSDPRRIKRLQVRDVSQASTAGAKEQASARSDAIIAAKPA